MKTAFVAGSSGFIGSHLVKLLQSRGYYVVGADIQEERYCKADLFHQTDLSLWLNVDMIFEYFDEIYILACLMGGMGYIGDEKHSYDIMVGSTQIVTNIIECSIDFKCKKIFFSSSACVYNEFLQVDKDNCSLEEDMAYPAHPDLVYGWQKLFSEHLMLAAKDKIDIRIARFHNIFGIEGTWDGGKEKAPAAICRKVAQAKDGESINIWGDGLQTRSFLYIDECLEGVVRLMNSDYNKPINIGSDELISINDLAKMVIEISGKNLTIEHDLTKPQGVRGRNSDNTLCEQVLGWKPSKSLREGMEKTYSWINQQVND